MLYVLDEPSVGLHPEDVGRLVRSLIALRERGNTVLVVEHDEVVIAAANDLIDLGPGAGRDGGRVLASGPREAALTNPASVTGQALRERPSRPVATSRSMSDPGRALRIRGASLHNLRGVDASFPLGALTCVTGVSGSGKSSLVMDTLLPAARAIVHRATPVDIRAEIEGLSRLDRVVRVGPEPLGKNARSTPATYVGIWSAIREVYASLPESRTRGYRASRFSFNAKGGRCERCSGEGVTRVGLQFLPDVTVVCAACGGARFDPETLAIRYRGHTIADVLEMDLVAAQELFAAHPKIAGSLAMLCRLGLGHLSLGRSATTLSGGEAQRVKLARELGRRRLGTALYVLDEPTTGLHPREVDLLASVLLELSARGDAVVVVEHDLRFIERADFVVELGPGAGADGGTVLYQGPVAGLAERNESPTGRALAARWARI